MIPSERRWNAAIAEHETVVREFVAACERCPTSDWNTSPAPGKWSSAAVALHVCHAYELGQNAMRGGPGMRLRVSKPYAWFLRNLLLPLIVATKRFPRGARAPREVVPDLEEARMLTPAAAAARLTRVADEAAAAFRQARHDRSAPSVTHAYFGALTPYVALRMLSAHTRHHARSLMRTL